MKNRLSNIITTLLFSSALLLACQGKQGDPGPTGQTGASGTNGTNGLQGPAGPQGPAGTNPQSSFVNGAFKATVSGNLQNSTAYNDSINFTYTAGYEYFSGTTASSNLSLFRSLAPIPSSTTGGVTSDSSYPVYFMELAVTNLGASNQSVVIVNSFLNYMTPLTGNQLLSISENELVGSNYTITNFVYNTSNGLLTFNFTINSAGANNSTGNPMTITGKFSGTVYVTVD